MTLYKREVGQLTKAAKRQLQKRCEVFHAARYLDGKLTIGFWLKIFDNDNDRWTRLEYLGIDKEESFNRIKQLDA